MKQASFEFDILTPCFCGGADPKSTAEIRPTSIRGQLRWWFRTLGGFRSLCATSVRDQERMLFGHIAGNLGSASKLVVRVFPSSIKLGVKDSAQLGHHNFSDPAFLSFPMQSRANQYAGRGVAEGSFGIQILWRGSSILWDDILALIAVLGHLGSLGFRSRRGFGALAFKRNPPSLKAALDRFANSDQLLVRTLGVSSQGEVLARLGRWLKGWRAHGRTGNNAAEQRFPGFRWAKSDHDQGAAVLAHRPDRGPTYRPALGLPIVQYFSGGRGTVTWDFVAEAGKGRFASPILLRPHRDSTNRLHALVIFADARAWQPGSAVHLNGQPREVSTELYEAMKADPQLKPLLTS